MAAVRALAALLVLGAAGAALADGTFEPARIVSTLSQERRAHGAGMKAGKEGVVPSDSGPSPLAWRSDWLYPIKPEAGKKQKTTLWITNFGDKVIPAGTLVSVWANKTEEAKCGETGDVDYKLPELLPLQTKAIKLSWKAPDATGEATVRVFIDSACTQPVGSYKQWSQRVAVVEAGTKYAYLQLAQDTPENFWDPPSDPLYPVRNSTYKAEIGVVNLGTAPSEAGVKMAVYYDLEAVPDNATTDCTYPGQISVDLPKINPGKVKILAVEAPAPDSPFADLAIFLDAACKLAPAPFKAPGRFYSTAAKPGAVLGGVVQKGQYSYIIKTTPKKPKVNGTMTVKVKVLNLGGADGSVGRIDIFAPPVDQAYVFEFFINRCEPTGAIYSANTTNLVIKAGKSKTVKITDVPVPGKAGWLGLAVVPDAGCANDAGVALLPVPYIAFEVVAP